MRIVGGRFRGRAIAGAVACGICGRRRIACARRCSTFCCTASTGSMLEGARVIDLFAGTGALGLEALSRGAAYCLFVEEAVEARALIRGNVEAMGLMGVTKIYRRDATSLGPRCPHQPFDLAFLDPPYGQGIGGEGAASVDRRQLAQGGRDRRGRRARDGSGIRCRKALPRSTGERMATRRCCSRGSRISACSAPPEQAFDVVSLSST